MPRCLKVGRGNARINVKRRTICLTESQERALQPTDQIGCGSYGCAYARPDGRVVKLTQDRDDVTAMEVMRGDPNVVPLHESYRVIDRFGGPPVYAVVVDRVAQPKALKLIVRAMGRPLRDFGFSPRARFIGIPGVATGHNDSARLVQETCAKRRKDRKECERVVLSLGDLMLRAQDIGVELTDIHEGNVGVDAEGNVRVFDLGFKSAPWEPEAQDLRGVRRSRGRLARR